MVSPFFFFPPFPLVIFVLIWSPLSVFQIQNPRTHYPFLFAHTLLHLLEQWNDNQDKNRAEEGTSDLLSVGGVCPLYPKYTSHRSILFLSFTFLPLKLDLPIYLK